VVVCDFVRSGADGQDLPELLRQAAFTGVEAQTVTFPRTHRGWSRALLVVGTA
jgi:hypothetical protein